MTKPTAIISTLAAATLALTASRASADVTVDIREAGTQNKILYVSSLAGHVIHLEAYALITGTDADLNNEGLQLLTGSIQTSGSVHANASNLQLASPFNAAGSAPGTLSDLDADGDLDIGSRNNGRTAGWILVRAAAMTPGTPFKLFTFDLTIAAGNYVGTSTVDWTYRNGGVATQMWRQDGISLNGSSQYFPKLKSSPAQLFDESPPPPPYPAPAASLGGASLLSLLSLRRRRGRLAV